MKKIFLLGFLFAAAFTANAADGMRPIITAVPSLTVNADARAGGMGEAGAATSPDANSQYWNPSKYVFSESSAGFVINYTPWMKKIVDDINLLYAAGYWKFGEMQSVSASLRYFGMGDIQVTNEQGDPLNTTSPYELSVDVAYARKLSERWAAAVALRYIRVDFGTVDDLFPGNAFAADIAASYRMPLQLWGHQGGLSFGLNLSNIGTKISYDDGNTNYYLPANFRLGTSFECPINEYNKITLSVDANKLMVPSTTYKTKQDEYGNAVIDMTGKGADESVIGAIFKSFSDAPTKEEFQEVAWALGLEYSYNNQFFVRTGYFYENENKGNRKFWTFGAGFKLNMLALDASYSLASQTNPLDQTLRFSLMFDIDGIRDLFNN